ncbi:MAG TPA: nucleotide exchange factor GrpE [Acidiferrobacteraceae bacterium]|nr:nucleotide exchange factor GrpE [Acidiferrobacteraceae bacterium]
MTVNKVPDEATEVAAEGAESSPGGTQGATDAELEAARAEIGELRDRFLRAKAEAENIRRRADLDIANARKFAIESFAAEVLNVRDNLERAQAVNLSDAQVVERVVEGLALTLSELDAILERQGLTRFDPVGEKFDPERHQAMTSVPAGEVPPGHIVQVMQKGYTLNGRLLRPAMVVVAGAPGT